MSKRSDHIASVYVENSPARIYFLILYNLFADFLDDVSEPPQRFFRAWTSTSSTCSTRSRSLCQVKYDVATSFSELMQLVGARSPT
jgi:hypothetical protein